MTPAGAAASPAPARTRVAPWRDERIRAIAIQVLTVALILGFAAYLAGNAAENLRRQGIATGFAFLGREASFAVSPTLIPFSPADTYARALLVGLLNTLLVASLGIVFATMLGFVVGIARLSSNWLVSRLTLAYVEVMRNTPLILQIFLWWDVLRVGAPQPRDAWHFLPHVFISNRGVVFPVPFYDPVYLWMLAALAAGAGAAYLLRLWARQRLARTGERPQTAWPGLTLVTLPPILVFIAGGAPLRLDLPQVTRFDFSGGQSITPEFAALLFALVAYSGAFIGEIVRSGIQSVSRGQSEAAQALGLSRGQTLRLVVLPQAIRVIVPPTTSEYLSLTKNSSLAVAIGFPELFSVSNTIANQTGQAIEVMVIVASTYLVISLAISLAMNLYNRWTALVER
ncbi:MAG TPA: ABC transporter permease subunit [Stellaceae bacterium]|nr:ABC transporter permease subunit [Stellaceae bacterium]